MSDVWHEINGQIWLKLKLNPERYSYSCVFVNLAYVQSVEPYTRTITMNGGLTYDVTEETLNEIVDGLGFKGCYNAN
jgi:hypothetical protein